MSAELLAPVFVSDGQLRASLAAVRALGRAGAPVHVLSAAPGSLAGVSRWAHREHRVPSLVETPADWAKAVADLLDRHPGAALLPISEMALVSAHRSGLCARFPVAAPSEAACLRTLDKPALLSDASEAGFDTPRGFVLAPEEPIDALPQGFLYPLIAKPRSSCWMHAGRWHRGGARRVSGPAALAAACAAAPGASLLIQEPVPGHGEGFFFLRHRGEIRASFAHRRVREKPPSGGVSTLSEGIPVDPQVAQRAERLLAALDYEGAGMLEFRRTPDGRAVLLELNPRLWGSLGLATRSGVDFASLAIVALRGGAVPAVRGRPGLRQRWLLGEVDHVIAQWRAGRSLPAAAALLRSFGRPASLEVWERDDPAPFRRELRSWLRRDEWPA